MAALATGQKNTSRLSRLFSPRAIAVYGVSRDTGKIGSTIFSNLVSSGYTGKLYPINPKYTEVFGYRCFNKAQDIPGRLDLAIMAIPGEFVMEVLRDCAKKKVKFLVVISAGFAEMGEEGIERERKLAAKAAELGVELIGPNSLGLLAADTKLNASFAATNIKPGDVAFMSQSGAICTAFLDMANSQGLGFSHFVSLGNKSGVTENDLLGYWLQSDKVKVIGAYLEQFVDGYDFITAQERLDHNKPVVLIHPGESAGARAAMGSHTGSLASPASLVKEAMRKYGISMVTGLTEAYAALTAFTWSKLPTGRRIAMVTNAGGPGILASDAANKYGFDLITPSEKLKAELAKNLPANSSLRNPIDIIGDANVARYAQALTTVALSDEVDIIFAILTPQFVTQIEETSKLLINLVKQVDKLIVPVFVGGKYAEAGLVRLQDNSIASYSDINTAMSTVSLLCDYTDYRKHRSARTTIAQTKMLAAARKPETAKLLEKHTKKELQALPEEVTQALLAEFEIPQPVSEVVYSWEQANEFLGRLKYTKSHFPRLVLKATSEDVIHKTEMKAIYLDINSPEVLKSSLTKLQEDLYHLTSHENPPVLIQEFFAANEELFIGLKRDGDANVYEKSGKGFGHLLLFGKGGIYAEIYQDIARGFLPLNGWEIRKLINTTKVSQILNGARGQKPLAVEKLAVLLEKLQALVIAYPELAEIDINPLLITQKRCVVADAKLFVRA